MDQDAKFREEVHDGNTTLQRNSDGRYVDRSADVYVDLDGDGKVGGDAQTTDFHMRDDYGKANGWLTIWEKGHRIDAKQIEGDHMQVTLDGQKLDNLDPAVLSEIKEVNAIFKKTGVDLRDQRLAGGKINPEVVHGPQGDTLADLGNLGIQVASQILPKDNGPQIPG